MLRANQANQNRYGVVVGVDVVAVVDVVVIAVVNVVVEMCCRVSPSLHLDRNLSLRLSPLACHYGCLHSLGVAVDVAADVGVVDVVDGGSVNGGVTIIINH